MSGSAFAKKWAILPNNYSKKFTELFARKLGYQGEINSESFVNFLEDVPAFEMMEAHNGVVTNDDQFENGIWNIFAPLIEPYVSANCVIPKSPIEMARNAWSNSIDVIFSATSLEGILFANNKEELACYYLQNTACFAPLVELNLQPTDPIAAEYGERIQKLYYKNNEKPSVDNMYPYLEYISDAMFWHDIYRSIQSRMAYSKEKTYLLRFHVNGSENLFRKTFKCDHYKEACHADDLTYIFKSSFLDLPAKDSKEMAVINKMVGMLTSFAITGSPNCPEIAPAEFIPQTSAESLKCIQITENDVTEISLPELSRLKVWDSVYNDHDVPLF